MKLSFARWFGGGDSLGLDPSETPLRVFVSSVMTPDLQWARDAARAALSRPPSVVPWLFEYTPASSAPVEQSYLQKVRECSVFLWLPGATTTEPVRNEVAEAIAAQRRLLVIRLPADKRDAATEQLIAQVKSLCKMASALDRAGLEQAIAVTFADEIARALRDEPGVGRIGILDALHRESLGRCISRWQAAGLAWDEASEWADDPSVGVPPADLAAGLPVRILRGDFGSGKSLALERIHQSDIASARGHAASAIPVFISPAGVDDLRAAVVVAAAGLGDPAVVGARIVIDGLDEVGSAEALELLDQARVLASAWPDSTVTISTRPAPGFAPPDVIDMPLLAEHEISNLISRITGTPYYLHGRDGGESLQEAIRRPLFAIIRALQIRRASREPLSVADLVAEMVRTALRVEPSAEEKLLRRLAVAITGRGGRPVPIADFTSSQDELDALRETRLISEQRSSLSFALPILNDWFAAKALIANEVAIEEIAASADLLEVWRQPLVAAVGTAGHVEASNILRSLTRAQPAFTASIVVAAINSYSWQANDSLPSALQAGRQLREAMGSWCEGIGPLARVVGPCQPDGSLMPVGIGISNGWLNVSWFTGDNASSDVLDPPTFDPNGNIGPGWRGLRGAAPASQPAWAWRWSLDELVDGLSALLKPGRLHLLGALRAEAIRDIVIAFSGRGNLFQDPIPVDEIDSQLQRLIDLGLFANRKALASDPQLGLLVQHIDGLRADGVLTIDAPYPGPDLAFTAGWVWNPYSPEQLLERTRLVFTAALEGYQEITSTLLEPLRPRMRLAATLPARLIGRLVHPRGEQGPGLEWYLDPLPSGSATTVDIQLVDELTPLGSYDELYALQQRLTAARPKEPWLHAVIHHQALHIFDQTPGAQLVLSWIEDDLKAISWFN